MSLDPPAGRSRGRWTRFRAYVTAPGVLSWGVPSAVSATIWLHGRKYGVSWASFGMLEFWVTLLVYVVILGILGGRAFGRTLGRFTPPPDARQRARRTAGLTYVAADEAILKLASLAIVASLAAERWR